MAQGRARLARALSCCCSGAAVMLVPSTSYPGLADGSSSRARIRTTAHSLAPSTTLPPQGPTRPQSSSGVLGLFRLL
ncbi:hypothetical protein BS50DRAFT_576792, partial [Corynespora cassiicola Philippines]